MRRCWPSRRCSPREKQRTGPAARRTGPSKKAFSVEWLDDHSEDELKRALSEHNENNDWQLYLDVRPSQSVIDAFLAEVNG
jgi:hypothetical protein